MAKYESAINKYRETIQLVGGLIALESGFPDPPPKTDESAVMALRGGAIVLLSATFERFLKDLGEEQSARLRGTRKAIKLSQLPDRIKVHSIFASLKQSMDGPRYGVKTEKKDRIPDIVDKCRLIGSDFIDSEVFSSTGGNPNSDAVKVIFNNLDVDDPFAKIKTGFETLWGKAVAQNFIKEKLDEIISKRHVIAHTADVMTISRSDINDHKKFMECLVGALYDHLNAHIGSIVDRI